MIKDRDFNIRDLIESMLSEPHPQIKINHTSKNNNQERIIFSIKVLDHPIEYELKPPKDI